MEKMLTCSSGISHLLGTRVSNVLRRLQSGALSAQGSPAAIRGCPAGSPALTSGLPQSFQRV